MNKSNHIQKKILKSFFPYSLLFFITLLTQNVYLNIETIEWDIASYLIATQDIKSGFLTSFSSILSISAGGSVGQYGPLVHFGATIGAEINDLFRNKASYEILIGAGVASAISSGFGAPLAGLIFAREVILRHQNLLNYFVL